MGSTTTFISLITILVLSGVHSQDLEKRMAGVGDELELKCVVQQEFKSCIFRTPSAETLFMFAETKLQEGRIVNSAFGLNPDTGYHECNMKIKGVKDIDNGGWECSVVSTVEGKHLTVTKHFFVTVAVPPTQLYLEEGDQKNPAELKFGMSSEEKDISCIAEKARPRPTFVWLLGDEELKAEFKDETREVDEDGKATYLQTLAYYPKNKKHNGKNLVCKIEHSGYSLAETEAKKNEATVQLLITYAPEAPQKATVSNVPKEKVGETVTIQQTFSANPKPTDCYWQIGKNETVRCGQMTQDDKYSSSNVEQGDDSNKWTVVLEIRKFSDDDRQDITLFLDNGEADEPTSYPFTFAKDDLRTPSQPEPGQASMTAVAVVLVVLILVVISIVAYARVKGLLCFAAKSTDEHDEEKEAFDNAEKGEAAPIVPEAKGDSAKPTEPEKKSADVIGKDVTSSSPPPPTESKPKDNKDEDKKSNGAHTPC